MPIPRTPPTAQLAKDALDWRPDAFSYIARRLHPVCSRQHVAGVAHGTRTSQRIEKALRLAIARRRYP